MSKKTYNTAFMEEAIAISLQKMQENEGGPFGAVIVKEGTIIARGWNRVTSANDPTAHAEITAIREACRVVKTFWLGDCEMYVNCEPCPMCLAAIYWAGIPRIYYAASRHDAADIGFGDAYIYDEIAKMNADKNLDMIQVMRDEALPVLASWEDKDDKIEY